MNVLLGSQFLEIRRHAEQDAPRECCGILTHTEIIRCTNLSNKPHTNWQISAHEIQRALGNTVFRGFYHSHINAPAIPSAEDLRQANWFNYQYAIASVMRSEVVDIRVYVLRSDGSKKFFERL